MFDDPFIDPFVTATDQDGLICSREPQCFGLIELSSCSAKHDDFDDDGLVLMNRFESSRFDSLENRFGLENHSFAAAERPVVDRPMAIRSEIPQVADSNIDESFFPASANHA